MFVSQHSSPKASLGQSTCQSTLDSLCWPRLRLNKGDTEADKDMGSALGTSGTGIHKGKNKKKDAKQQHLLAASEEGLPDKDESAANGPPQHTIHSVAEGRAFLEEEALIGSDEGLDLDVMAGALIQISAMKGMPATARYAVRSITLILAQLKLESISEVVANMMEKSFEALLAKTVEKVTDSLKDSIESLILEIRAASTNVATSATQIAAMTTLYRDALKNSLGLAGGANTMDVCVHAREGVKAQQLLIDM